MPFLNSMKVPRFFGRVKLDIYPRTKLTSFWYFSSPSHWMKLLLAIGLPSLKAVRPFSAKQKSNRDVTFVAGVASCSCCLTRSEPPTCVKGTVNNGCSCAGCCRRMMHHLRSQWRTCVGAGREVVASRGIHPVWFAVRKRFREFYWWNDGGNTCRAGVRVPSTSNRQIVLFTGRFSREGYRLAPSVVIVAIILYGQLVYYGPIDAMERLIPNWSVMYAVRFWRVDSCPL